MTTTKLIIPLTCLLLFIGLIACNNSSRNTNKNVSEDATSKELQDTTEKTEKLDTFEEFNITKINASELKTNHQIPVAIPYWKRSEEEEMVEYTEFYPLGWSKDGLFAWLKHSVTYHGGDEMIYTIQDIKSNKVVWSYATIIAFSEEEQYNEEADPDVVIQVDNMNEIKNEFELIWAVNEEKVVKALKENGIEYKPSNLILKQAVYNEVKFDIEIKQGNDEENPFEYYLNNNKGEIALLEKGYQEARYTQIVGILENPYGGTVAVLCEQRRQFFEMTDEVVPLLAGFQL